MKHPAKTEVAVLILFFNRPEMLQRLFGRIKEARPAHLLFYQDGPRSEADLEKMKQCRDIVSDEAIDWDCTVDRHYCEQNYGCDPASYYSIKWAFSHYDRCIKFEDDDLPALSFFPFCQELLERYADDERISIISGLNLDGETTDIPYDYFFTRTFSINGWASWRRVIDLMDDEHYGFLDDQTAMRQLGKLIKAHHHQQDFIKFCKYHRQTGKAYYETLLHAAIFLNSGLSIVPRVNMIQNAGATEEGTHYAGSNDTLPRAIRRIFTMKARELQMPLHHPRYVIEDEDYRERVFRTMGWGHPWLKVGRSFEELWLNLRHGNLKRIWQAANNRLRIWAGHTKWD